MRITTEKLENKNFMFICDNFKVHSDFQDF